MSDYKAAAKVLRGYTGDRFDPIETIVAQMFAAQFVTDYGCAKCGGNGTQVDDCPGYEAPCPAEHVELVNPHDNKTIYADPKKCRWQCVDWNITVTQRLDGPDHIRATLTGWHPPCEPGQVHKSPAIRGCGWVPIHPTKTSVG